MKTEKMNIDEHNSKIINVDNSHQSLNLNTEMDSIIYQEKMSH